MCGSIRAKNLMPIRRLSVSWQFFEYDQHSCVATRGVKELNKQSKSF
jgi:hypothetical protein